MAEISDEDRERVKLLQLITNSKHEFKKLTLEQLKRLQELVEKKITVTIKKHINLKSNC
jgi:hypothetical protein